MTISLVLNTLPYQTCTTEVGIEQETHERISDERIDQVSRYIINRLDVKANQVLDLLTL